MKRNVTPLFDNNICALMENTQNVKVAFSLTTQVEHKI